MGGKELGKLCKNRYLISTIIVFLGFAFNSNRVHALSVDYSKHHCNHEHPKAHEASLLFVEFSVVGFAINLLKVESQKDFLFVVHILNQCAECWTIEEANIDGEAML